ncbi:FIG054872: Sortase-like protein [Alloactinosynnema sp. L-07]|uniref:class E sortase n=1 Tax=Alloactinosynnema sp. L-07 TaxID=1653480 RepID=UPI00065F0969|nr:class E sortase [Alloactinosynnema sp. L-07]CRK62067.1 FIG054872: Sortase-like protein [Alloactinosynnema sp. L-07]
MYGDRRQPPPPRRPYPAEAPTEIIRPVRPPDPPTEFIPVYRGDDAYDGYDDDDHYNPHDDFDGGYDQDYRDPPKRRRSSPGLIVVRSVGELLITAGLVVLLFVVYEVWITDILSAEKQADVTTALEDEWKDPAAPDPERTEHFSFADGEGIAKLYVPALGSDYKFTIVEGTSEANLEVGPGHYKQSAAPGAPGNFAVAGHRVGKGAPFNDLDLLESCDAIIVETRANWYVYRLLPTTADAKNWAARAGDPRCAGGQGSTKVEPMTGEYAKAVGRHIVTPRDSGVVAPVPGNPAAKTPADQRRKLITLTTCHPKFSNKQRMILHGTLVRAQPKDPANPTALPPELTESN